MPRFSFGNVTRSIAPGQYGVVDRDGAVVRVYSTEAGFVRDVEALKNQFAVRHAGERLYGFDAARSTLIGYLTSRSYKRGGRRATT